MSEDIASQKDKSIDDLIKLSQPEGRVHVSSDEVEEKLKTKIKEIDEKKKEEATREAAEGAGYDYIFLKGFPVGSDALALFPEEEARRLQAVCFFKTDREIRIGAVRPESAEVASLLQRLEQETQTLGALYQISELSLEAVLKLYASLPRPRKFTGGVEVSAADLDKFTSELSTFRDLATEIQRVSTSDLFTLIMAAAIKSTASDVHIEAELDDVKIRYRIDGVLYDVATLPKKLWPKVVNRAKLLAKLKINISDIPQDGRFSIYLAKEFIDVRVSTVPSAYGESIVMRLLMSSAAGLQLEDIGLVGSALDIIKQEVERPNGMILTTGPTGSGKTTTLYSILKRLNKPELKIITLENPIEYRVKGVTQSQVEISDDSESGSELRKMLKNGGGNKRHFTYATGLRAVLRQDPDIVMVGEIRDHETAEIAIQAALTGHLMLSTLHTNSAAGAIPRLLSMDVRPFLLAPSLNVIVGQRLVRKVCPDCSETYAPAPEVVKRVTEVLATITPDRRNGVIAEAIQWKHGKGCQKCSLIGFRGRVGLFEILTMNEEIEQLILTGKVSEFQIQNIATKHGMLTMLQDGVLKVAQGITTPEEVFDVTG